MAREKVADPAYQKLISESIQKENKIRKKWHLDVICGLPHTAKVNWDEDFESDDDANTKDEPLTTNSKEFLMSDDTSSVDNDKKAKNVNQFDASYGLKDTPQQNGKMQKDLKIQSSQSRYVFPVCDYCDFGWRFDSNKCLFCPRHGPRTDW